MSITPQFIDQLRERVPLSEVIGRFVSWDQKKSRPAQGDFWAPCPFHTEKTASFHADDRKGFYYCFGCQQKGDAITFLKEKASLDFVDAVRELAGMAGMEMPALDPKSKEKADVYARLVELQEQAAKFYSLQLNTSAGSEAREYLYQKRGLSEAVVQQFRLGFAPNTRDQLLQHMRQAGFSDAEIIQGGLALRPDDGGNNFDRFRNRIMFPILDGRGRTVAFGGRAMDANAKAKYLNSAESPIFHKGRLLYNYYFAKRNFSETPRFILVEGYMDVIALWQSGFFTGLAPLGTAMTLEQLETMWRIDRAPILALDGDQAGQRAALRAANLALPHITADRSLRFALLPAGQDPDDLIKSEGAGAMKELLRESIPLVDMLWQSALDESDLSTPEGRAAFDAKLKAIAGQIEDTSLKAHYLVEFRERRKSLWERAKTQMNTDKGQPTKRFKTLNFPPKAHEDFRVALILRTILSYPQIGKKLADDLGEISCQNGELERLRKEMVMAYGDESAINRLATPENLSILQIGSIINNLRFLNDEGQEERALDITTDEIARLTMQSRAKEEINQILNNLQNQELDEEQEALLRSAVIMRDEARKILDDQIDDDADKRAFLRQFLESERWRK